MLSYLVDPQSAQFSDVNTSGGATCGLVNSKNRMGGYTGQKSFIVREGRVSFVGSETYLQDMVGAPCSTEVFSVRVREIVNM